MSLAPPPPKWAATVPEAVWMQQILSRPANPPMAAPAKAEPAAPSASAASAPTKPATPTKPPKPPKQTMTMAEAADAADVARLRKLEAAKPRAVVKRCTCPNPPPLQLRMRCPMCCAKCDGALEPEDVLALHVAGCPNDRNRS